MRWPCWARRAEAMQAAGYVGSERVKSTGNYRFTGMAFVCLTASRQAVDPRQVQEGRSQACVS